MSGNYDDMFVGDGVPFLKFPTIGTKYSGVIADMMKRQQRDFQTGEPAFWTDGEPKLELIVTIDTEDGPMRLAIKKGTQMWGAFADELRAKNASGPEIGAKIAVAYTGDGESKTRGFAPPKLYAFAYEKPTKKVDDMFNPKIPTTTPAAAPSDAASLSKLLAPF